MIERHQIRLFFLLNVIAHYLSHRSKETILLLVVIVDDTLLHGSKKNNPLAISLPHDESLGPIEMLTNA